MIFISRFELSGNVKRDRKSTFIQRLKKAVAVLISTVFYP